MSYVTSPCASRHSSCTILLMKHTANNGAFMVVSAPECSVPAAAATEAYGRIGDALREGGLQIVQERVFASLSAMPAVKAARYESLAVRGIHPAGPVTCIQGCPAWGEGFAGVIIRAVPAEAPADVRTILDGGSPCGRAWRSDGAEFILLQNIQGTAGTGEDNAPAAQARRAIERADRLLRENGADYTRTVRTWFYLSDILSWYSEFNQARNALYHRFGLLPRPAEGHILPASTGIRAGLSGGAACSLDLLAVAAPEGRGPAIKSLKNPRQQEAFRYGSAFSRCAVVQGPDESLIELSGTAAIDEKGVSLHPGDVRAQIRCTLDKVSALIGQAGATLADICAASLFVKHGEHADIVREELAETGLENFPAVCVVADVCRDELLFEVDAEAVVTR